MTARSSCTGTCPAKQAHKLLKQLREDLVGLDAEQFIARWEGADSTDDWPL